MISFAGDSVTQAVVMLLIDRRDQLTLMELMILSGVRMLLAFLGLGVNREGARRTSDQRTKRRSEDPETGTQ